ncbi:alpha/beta fold hydrolase [Xanthomonas sp. NCPPB 2632]|jgi:predicted alpha/beta hydrolase|uniref:alpha/beta hydrolase family protein n=1 Tax=Xanthomonas sp. NCPPB 2632 TaxID=3240912 RepID=UPI0035140109
MTDSTPDIVTSAQPLRMTDGASADLLIYRPAAAPPRAALLWLPAMGVGARHYDLLARALAARGVAVALHEWRGLGSSDRRASRRANWGYRELLGDDLPASLAALRRAIPEVPVHIGGHSLGGQLACLLAATSPLPLAGVILVGSGAPYWRRFKPWVALAYMAAPALANLVGRLPGRRIGFGGNEARGVIADWARSGRKGTYSARGLRLDLEGALRGQRSPVLALRLQDDWLAPAASLDFLLGKMPDAPSQVHLMSPADLDGQAADHFTWMKAPDAIARRIADGL